MSTPIGTSCLMFDQNTDLLVVTDRRHLYERTMLVALNTEIVLTLFDRIKQSMKVCAHILKKCKKEGKYLTHITRGCRAFARRALDMIRGFTAIYTRSEAETET